MSPDYIAGTRRLQHYKKAPSEKQQEKLEEAHRIDYGVCQICGTARHTNEACEGYWREFSAGWEHDEAGMA